MNREQFKATIQELEVYAQQNPRGYRRRVGMMALLGYGYIWLVLMLLVALLAGLVAFTIYAHQVNFGLIKIGLLLLVVAWAVARSLWVKFPRPEGVPLTREQVPELFVMLDELTTRLQAPRFHHVLLVDDFNAAVAQVPKLGLFGWYENYLLLGLPLMQALPPDQLRSVVAHELGHLSQNHAKFSGWIYRVYQTWEQIGENFSRNGNGGAWMFQKFFNWYAPRFGALSFVLRRADEYVADRCAMELTNVRACGDALINSQVRGQFLQERFWPEIYKSASSQNQPPQGVFSDLSSHWRSGLEPQQATQWLQRAFLDRSDYDDTHPSLSDRLNALGYFGDGTNTQSSTRNDLESLPVAVENFVQPLQQSAATRFLGAAENDLTTKLNAQWHDAIAPAWQQQNEETQQGEKTLLELEDKATRETLSEDEQWQQVHLTSQVRGEDAALPLMRAFVERFPAHAPARFLLGTTLLGQKNDEGIALLEGVMRDEKEITLDVCGALYDYAKAQGRHEDAARHREQAEAFMEQLQEAQAERNSISAKDSFVSHTLTPEQLQSVRDILASEDRVATAYLARKQTTNFSEVPHHVLGIATRQTSAKFLGTEDNQALVQKLLERMENLPVDYFLVFSSETRKIENALSKVEGSQIYSREKKSR
ncbi:MAG TPA: M48 family metallopeptidase [Abditibacteriaceae bacterium]|nr:M48 family metallopeptidase [Abditibacteriaceae bacterium]